MSLGTDIGRHLKAEADYENFVEEYSEDILYRLSKKNLTAVWNTYNKGGVQSSEDSDIGKMLHEAICEFADREAVKAWSKR